jgi:hypothetical protein
MTVYFSVTNMEEINTLALYYSTEENLRQPWQTLLKNL